MLAGEEASRERVVRDDRKVLVVAQRQQFPLDLAEQQVVAGLHTLEAHDVQHLAAAEGTSELVREEVAAADVAHLAGAHHVVECLHRLVERCVRVPEVHLVEVDVIGLQSAQRVVECPHDVVA
ncbi:unannotated protein [freshwater metagenome]|uniref:Unannotated protein n=1 Tax=freshwater metagenome TaxID=449393 RepID=A0A6J7UR18_9ZZZZ